MRHGIVLFTSDRGIAPAELASAAEERGFDTFYVPEHTHIPVRRDALHPTGGTELPDDRYLRTLDPWVTLGTCAAVTSRIGLSTAVALPVESDPITLAKTIATHDHLSDGRVSLGVGFGWNTDELAAGEVVEGSDRLGERDRVRLDRQRDRGREADPRGHRGAGAERDPGIGLSTAVALPVESDPITLAKTIATLDHLSGGRVSLGVGFGWNTDELADHGIPGDRKRTALKEYLEAMRALWTEEEAAYHGKFVDFGPSWAYPKPPQGRIPTIVGAGGGPKTLRWIANNAEGWMSTPTESGIGDKVKTLQDEWESAGREGKPEVRVLVAKRPTPDDLAEWSIADELIWGVPDSDPTAVLTYLDKLATRLDLR